MIVGLSTQAPSVSVVNTSAPSASVPPRVMHAICPGV